MYLWNELSQPELDALTYALLKAMRGGKTAAHKSSEHAWEALCALPGVPAADADTIRDVVHTLQRVGFLVGVEDKGDTVACGGLTQSGLARLRVCEGRSPRPLEIREPLILWALAYLACVAIGWIAGQGAQLLA